MHLRKSSGKAVGKPVRMIYIHGRFSTAVCMFNGEGWEMAINANVIGKIGV